MQSTSRSRPFARTRLVAAVCIAVGASAWSARAQQTIQPLMGAPLTGLSAAERDRFERGREAFFHVQTVAEGLGPITNRAGFSARCIGCHIGPAIGGGSDIVVTRFGMAASGSSPFDPLPGLGGPILQVLVPNASFATCFEILPPQANVVSRRVTPPLFGFGLVEAIADADIQAREALPPPGVSGKANLVTPVETPLGPPRVGRFGWKAQIATLLGFSGDAFRNELGITNRLFPLDLAPNGPPTASQACDGVADPEDGPDAQGLHKIDRVADFMRFLAPPPQTPRSGMSGAVVFESVGCSKCHVSTPFVTLPSAAETALQNRPLRPYSDFLVHDMGQLGDGMPDGLATETEFRTPPLWGVGFRAAVGLLHDDSANSAGVEGNLHAAILAHDGEAAAVAAAYAALGAGDQSKLRRFLVSLGQAEFDLEYNNTVDEIDWYFLRPALTGPGAFFTPDDPSAIADLDQDGDFDLGDLAGLQRAFTGP